MAEATKNVPAPTQATRGSIGATVSVLSIIRNDSNRCISQEKDDSSVGSLTDADAESVPPANTGGAKKTAVSKAVSALNFLRICSDKNIDQKKNTDADTAYVAPVKKRQVIPPRDPLPHRKKRNNHPADPDLPPERQSGAQVSTATTRKALIALKLAELEEAKIAMLAEMELDDEAEEAEEEANSIKTLADLPMMSTSQFAALGAALGESPHSSDAEDVPLDMQTFCMVTDLDKDYETLVAEKKKQDMAELHSKVVKVRGQLKCS
jgi:hypothetical protein